jgi:hypothetical protein
MSHHLRRLLLGLAEELGHQLPAPLGPVGQAAFYRQIAQADQRDSDEIEPRYATLRLSRERASAWSRVTSRVMAMAKTASLRLTTRANSLLARSSMERPSAVQTSSASS